MSVLDFAARVFRDWENYGVPASGAHDPVKAEIRALFAQVVTLIGSDDIPDQLAADIAAIAAQIEGVQTSASQSEAAKDAAVASAAAALASRLAAQSSADDAEAARDATMAYAELTGPFQFYATKAEANAALAGLPANQLVQVWADESEGGARTVYKKVSGSYVLQAELSYVMPAALASADGPSLVGWKPSAPARLRLLGDRVGEVVSVLDYVVGNGSADDTEAYQQLTQGVIASGARELTYPDGIEIAVTDTVLMNGERTHRFFGDARVTGDVEDGFVLRGLGYTDLLPLTVDDPIARGATSFEVNSPPDLEAGDDFYLYDVGTQEFDLHVVRKVTGNFIFTKRPINYAFATAANIRVYSMQNACRNLRMVGGVISNVNDSTSAHGLGFVYATDFRLDGVKVDGTGGIGVSIENSMRWRSDTESHNTGTAGFGCRNVRDFEIRGFVGRYPGHDESLVFYKNCTFGEVFAPDIEQYLFNEAPPWVVGTKTAGNCILLDERCCDITIRDPRLRGSGTYPILINNGSDRNRILNPDIMLANLGGVRIKSNSNDNYVGGGWIADVVNATDSEQSGIPTAAIQDDATCSGNVLGDGTRFARIAGDVNIRQAGASPAAAGTRLRGAMVKKSDNQTSANYTTPTPIAWDAEIYDTNAIHDNAVNNTRLTVPAGVSFVQLGCTLTLGSVGNPSLTVLWLKKNGSASFDGFCGLDKVGTGNPDPNITCVSGPIAVTAGDYFEWQLYCDDSSITVVAASSNAWMTLIQ